MKTGYCKQCTQYFKLDIPPEFDESQYFVLCPKCKTKLKLMKLDLPTITKQLGLGKSEVGEELAREISLV